MSRLPRAVALLTHSFQVFISFGVAAAAPPGSNAVIV